MFFFNFLLIIIIYNISNLNKTVKENKIMAQLKKKSILGIATIIGIFKGMQIYRQQKRQMLEEKEQQRAKQWANL